MTLTILIYANVFMLGWLAGWFVFDYTFYRPLRKQMRMALNDWKDTLDMCAMLAAKSGYKVEQKDGSVLSPIQIKKP